MFRPEARPARRGGRVRAMAVWTVCVVAAAVVLLVTVPALLGGDGVVTPILAAAGGVWALGFIRLALRPMATAAPMPAATATSDAGLPRSSRHLTILFADIEGYAAMTGASARDELLRMLDDVGALVRRAIAPRGGRLVKTVGDAFLVTFESATDALLAGQDVLTSLTAAGANAAAKLRPVRLRVGVASGEVTLHQGDVFGEAVNLAARLQAVADAERVYFSESTYHAMTRAEVPHEEVGVMDLKNIGPTRVFRTRNA